MGNRRPRPSFFRVAAALTVFSILPAAALANMVLARPSALQLHPSPGDEILPPLYGTPDMDNETVDALLRGRASDLFASFEWNGSRVRGSFVEFGYNLANGTLTNFTAKGAGTQVVLVSAIQVEAFALAAWPEAHGPRFAAPGTSLLIEARDDTMSSLEFVTNGTAHRVTFVLPREVTEVATHWRPDSWPASSVVFSIGETRGLLVLGSGTFEVAGLSVVARMASTDLLVLKSIPAFVAHRSEKTAVLDAIASGRLASEMSVVAMMNGTLPTGRWVESKVSYRLPMVAVPEIVVPRHAVVRLNATGGGAIVLVAFDPETMPADASSRLVVKANDAEVSETTDTLGTFYASESKGDKPFYARLPLLATVVAVYLPSLASVTIDVESIPIETGGPLLDAASEAAMIVALGIVSIAAAYMFRRKRSA